jgi:hypothetical protein
MNNQKSKKNQVVKPSDVNPKKLVAFVPPVPDGFCGKILHVVEHYGLFPVVPADEVSAKRQRQQFFGNTENPTVDAALIQDPLLNEAANPERQGLEVAPNALVPPTGLSQLGLNTPLPNGPTDEVYTDLRNRPNTGVYDVTGLGNISPFGSPIFNPDESEQIGYDHGMLWLTHRGINGIRTPGQLSFKLAPTSSYNTQYPDNVNDPFSADSFTCSWNFVLPGGTINTFGIFESSPSIDSVMSITGMTGKYLQKYKDGFMYCHPRGGNASSSNDPSTSIYDVFFFLNKRDECCKKNKK